jgi:hypothetical protein
MSRSTLYVLYALIGAIVLLSTSNIYIDYVVGDLCFDASLNDTDPNVTYHIVYPYDSVCKWMPIIGADRHRLRLENNLSATTVDPYKLRCFACIDDVHFLRYKEGSFICTDAAETFHNDAERAGIKCGLVRIDFGGLWVTGHTINVFKFKDGTYAFVDSTPSEVGNSSPRFLYVKELNHDANTKQELTTWFSHFLKHNGIVNDYHVYW